VPPLKVPERFRNGIVRVAELGQIEFEQLISALQKAPACQDTRELLAWIKDETPLLTESDRVAIISAIVPMLRVQRNADVSAQAFARDVWDSLASAIPKAMSSLEKDLVITRVSLLIEQSSLDVASARINDVKREVERNFCKVRILTDLRPAYKKDSDDAPSDMAVIHNFQIGYHDGMSNHNEFYLSLDGRDLELLKKAIAEAEARASILERTLEKSGIRIHR